MMDATPTVKRSGWAITDNPVAKVTSFDARFAS